MALKKPSELFGKKGDNSKISENINGNLNNIKQQFDKVEELKKELEGVTNSIDSSLSEVVDNSINFVEFKEEYSEQIDKLNKKIDSFERIYANGQTSGQCGTLHIDDGDSTFLYYPNPEWKTDYQGHLIFFNGDEEDSEACRIVEYKPNRAIFFDGKIPHYADAPDRCYNDLRISLAYKLKHSTI